MKMSIAMPDQYDIDRYRQLLAMYRSLLAEYLRQQQQWKRTEVLGFLSTSITVIRGHILSVKGTLRGWKVEVNDHPDDEDPHDDRSDSIQHQRDLLKIHRRNLAMYLEQQQHIPAGYMPPMHVHSLDNARGEIQRIKAILGGWGVAVEDLPEEALG